MTWCIERRHDMAAPCAEHVAADDGGQLDGPDEPRWQPSTGGFEERGPEQVPSLLEWVGDGDDDVLSADQQVRQVVRHEVADGDGQQSGPGGGHPHEARHAQGGQHDDSQEAGQQQAARDEVRTSEQLEEDLRL